MIYATHEGVKTNEEVFSDAWIELFQERQEKACRLYGKGSSFQVEVGHDHWNFYEIKPDGQRHVK